MRNGTVPDKLAHVLTERAKIGLTAELQVLEHERETVGQRDAANVIHVALENTNAGFDIASIRRDEETGELHLRMIEVKAGLPKGLGFHAYTRNDSPRSNREHGCLFPVPGAFDSGDSSSSEDGYYPESSDEIARRTRMENRSRRLDCEKDVSPWLSNHHVDEHTSRICQIGKAEAGRFGEVCPAPHSGATDLSRGLQRASLTTCDPISLLGGAVRRCRLR